MRKSFQSAKQKISMSVFFNKRILQRTPVVLVGLIKLQN